MTRPLSRYESLFLALYRTSLRQCLKITSRFDGVIKELHYEPEAMAQVGKVRRQAFWLGTAVPD